MGEGERGKLKEEEKEGDICRPGCYWEQVSCRTGSAKRYLTFATRDIDIRTSRMKMSKIRMLACKLEIGVVVDVGHEGRKAPTREEIC